MGDLTCAMVLGSTPQKFEGVEDLHAAGILKPENILIGADGHIVLADFSLERVPTANIGYRRSLRVDASGPWGGELYSSVSGTTQPATPPCMKTED